MKLNRKTFCSTVLLFSLLMTALGNTENQPPNFILNVFGVAGKSVRLTLAEFAKMPRRTVQAKNHDGKDCMYEGVELREIMTRVGVTFGKELRGKLLSSVVLVEAADNYKAVFALPEMDALFTDKIILLADTCDGKPLEKNGSLQMIVPDEKRHARWVQQVSAITLVQVEKEK